MNAFERCGGDLHKVPINYLKYKLMIIKIIPIIKAKNQIVEPMKTIINACTKSTTMNINSNNSKIKKSNNKSNINKEAPYIAERILQTMVIDWY